MFERLERRGGALAREQAEAWQARIAARIEAAVPGVTVSAEGDAVKLSGRGLMRRYGRSAALRWTIAEAKDER